MLQELFIKDFAIIDQLTISFEKGMSVLTGETGAGKSIIIDAVSLLTGGRGSSSFVRSGTHKAILEGQFVVPSTSATLAVLDDYGIAHEDTTIVLQREISNNGRNVCRVNGQLVNLASLKRIGETLVDIHGQNEHQSLMQVDQHINLLDEYADTRLQVIKERYTTAYQQYQQLRQTLKQKQANEHEWAQRLDMLRFQVNEIDEANLQPHEEEQLLKEREQLDNFQTISDALQQSYAALSTDNGSLDQIGVAMDAMNNIANLDEHYHDIAETIQSAYYALQDAGNDISNQLDSLEFDESRLDTVEKRLELINQLKRKYGNSVTDIIAYGEKAHHELAMMEQNDTNNDELLQKMHVAQIAAQQLAEQMSQIRHQVAQDLQKQVHQQLAALYMDKAVFEVRFTTTTSLHANGIDQVEFYIQTNPGEKMLPLVKIASGGELSRLMLALKTIFARSEGVTSIIFDEVDTGVSGRVAQAIADKMYDISRYSQVLCITHLPQVAAISDYQFLIVKHVHDGRTATSVTPVSGAARVDALAQMLSGTTVTKLTIEHAQELLKLAHHKKHDTP